MADRTVNIGLSPGADICWPICYETLLESLNLDSMQVADHKETCARVGYCGWFSIYCVFRTGSVCRWRSGLR